MIKFTKLQLKTILNKIIIKLELSSNFDCILDLNYNDEGSYFSKIASVYKLNVGCSFLNHYKDNDFILNKNVVDVIVNIFHEYQHALRNYEMYHNFQKGCEEIYVSSFTSAYFPYYYHLKHRMSPNELDAELNGILNAKAFFEEFFLDFDFESAIVERVNELFEDNCWYGPFNDSELKMVFSYDEIVDYLKNWQTFSYEYTSLLDTNNKDFKQTIEYSLLDTKDNGIKHYDDMLQYIKEFKILSYEDNSVLNKLVDFSKERTKVMEDTQYDKHTLYDDRNSR